MNAKITATDIRALFSEGNIIDSGGRKSKYRIEKISENSVKIQPTQAKTPANLRYDRLSIVLNNFSTIDSSKIEASVFALLKRHGLPDTQSESYLYGFAREYLQRELQGSIDARHLRFEQELEESLRLDPKQREKRLLQAPNIPAKTRVTTYIFERNPDVVAEVLYRAKGVCEKCKKKGPFKRRSNGSLYLEVHHTVPLAQGGEDTVKNAIAVCPNCHREAHYG